MELKEFATINMGQSPKGETYNTDGNGMPFLQGRKTFGRIYPTIDTWTTDPIKIANKDEILMSVRAPVGDMNFANKEICIGRGLCSISAKNGRNKYLYYMLLNSMNDLKRKSTGTVFDSINRKDLENLEINFHSEEEQEKIEKILASLDDKIELNNEINNNLYELSNTLHQNWVNERKNRLNSQLINIKSIGKIIMGQSPRGTSYNYEHDGLPLINGAADYSNGYLKAQKYTTQPTKVAHHGDLIFCIRATIGLLVISDGDYCLGRGVASITNIDKKYKEYIFHIIDNSIAEFKRMATGSVILGISREDIEKINVIIPSEKEIVNYHRIQEPLINKIECIRKENEKLEELRDTLLPKLMNGEIDLDNIEI